MVLFFVRRNIISQGSELSRRHTGYHFPLALILLTHDANACELRFLLLLRASVALLYSSGESFLGSPKKTLDKYGRRIKICP